MTQSFGPIMHSTNMNLMEFFTEADLGKYPTRQVPAGSTAFTRDSEIMWYWNPLSTAINEVGVSIASPTGGAWLAFSGTGTSSGVLIVPTNFDLANVDASKRVDGNIAFVDSMTTDAPVAGRFQYHAASLAIDTNGPFSQLVVRPTAIAPGDPGRWIRCDNAIDLVLPFSFATLDGAQLLDMTGMPELTLQPEYNGIQYEVINPFTGGAGPPKVGLSWTNGTVTARTKGSLAGGVAGNSGMTYVGYFRPTLGIDFALVVGTTPAIVLDKTAKVYYDRIADAYTAGAAKAHIPCTLWLGVITPVPAP